MSNYKHTDAAIKAANAHTTRNAPVLHAATAYKAFLAGVEWAERWMPVEEGLPNHGLKVLCLIRINPKGSNNEYRSIFGTYYDDCGWHHSDGSETYFKVTHWKHLPNPQQ